MTHLLKDPNDRPSLRRIANQRNPNLAAELGVKDWLFEIKARQAGAAASEFQKIIDHRGVVVNEPIGALAHPELARAHALQAQSAPGADADVVRSRARVDYQDFLILWKDAGSGISILKQARAEYAKLLAVSSIDQSKTTPDRFGRKLRELP